MKKYNVVLCARDYKIMLFIWKWKVTTTRIVELKFYPDSKGTAAYYRLWRLARAGFIASKSDVDRKHSFWVLTGLGFSVIKSELPPLAEDGYKSENLKHDFLASAAHLGDWAASQPPIVSLYSEQELRRIDPKEYPKWVPTSKICRPDGYWYIADDKIHRLVALEMELSQKRLESYESVARFYLEDTHVDQVLWIVKKPSYAVSIQKRILSTISASENIHSFVPLDDFFKSLWQAKITAGKDVGKSIKTVLTKMPQDDRKTLCSPEILDTRKFLIKSATVPNIETLKFVN